MTTDDSKGKPGAGAGTKGGKDLDELKARLGLKKGPEGAQSGAPGAAQQPAGQASSLEDFKFSFGQKPQAPGAGALSDKEFAAIEERVAKAAKPLGLRLSKWIGGVVLLVALAWIGYQYGNSMGLRVIHNESVAQAQRVLDFFTKSFSDAAGAEVSSRRDATAVLADYLAAYTDERFGKFSAIQTALSNGELPPGFDFEAFKKEDLGPLKKTCETYMSAVEEYSVDALLGGQLYATELGAKLLEFVTKANVLRSKVETLYVLIQLIESFGLPEPPPANLKPKLLLLATKGEKEKDNVGPVTPVEINGTPEVDRELTTKEICEPVSMEIEIPICGAGKNDPQTEKRLLEVFEKKETQEVKPYRKIRLKTEADKRDLTAKIGDLFELDMKPYLVPLLERIGNDRKTNAGNMGILFEAFLNNLSTIKESAPQVDYQSIVDLLTKFAGQETYFSL